MTTKHKFKVGDRVVILWRNRNATIEVVYRVTPTGMFDAGGIRFNANGLERSTSARWFRIYVHPVESERGKKLIANELKRRRNEIATGLNRIIVSASRYSKDDPLLSRISKEVAVMVTLLGGENR